MEKRINQERYSQNVLTQNSVINKYISLAAHSVIGVVRLF